MAKQTIEVLVDDLTGEPIPEGKGQTVTITVNDMSTEVDLSNEHAAELQSLLAPYFNARSEGRKQTAPAARRSMPTQRRVNNQGALKEIRKWARKNGYKVSERGRIPYPVMDAYTKAHMLTNAKG